MLIDTLRAEAVEARLIAQQARAEAAMQRATAEQARTRARQTVQVTVALQRAEAERRTRGLWPELRATWQGGEATGRSLATS